MNLTNSAYRLDGIIGYEYRSALLRLAEDTGIGPEIIVSLALRRLFDLPEKTRFRLLAEYHQLLDDPQSELMYSLTPP